MLWTADVDRSQGDATTNKRELGDVRSKLLQRGGRQGIGFAQH